MKKIFILFTVCCLMQDLYSDDLFLELDQNINVFDKKYKNGKLLEYPSSGSYGKVYNFKCKKLYVYFDKKTKKVKKILISKKADFSNKEITYILDENKGESKWFVFISTGKEIHSWIRGDGRVKLGFLGSYNELCITKTDGKELENYNRNGTLYIADSFNNSGTDFGYKFSIDFDKRDELYDIWNAYLNGMLIFGEPYECGLFFNNVFIPNFDAEVNGRVALVKAFSVAQKKGTTIKDKYLNDLLKIYEAGFIREYTWKYLKHSSWQNLPDNLNMQAFTAWAKKNLKNHRIETHGKLICPIK